MRFLNKLRLPWFTATPGSPEGGDTWYRSDNGQLYFWDAVNAKERLIGSSQRSETVPHAQLTAGTGQVATTGANTIISFLTVRDNTDNMLGTSPYTRLFCTTPGVYLFEGFLEWVANATGLRTLFLRHTAAIGGTTTIFAYTAKANAGAGATTDDTISGTFKMAAGDFVEMLGVQASGGNLNVNAAEFSATWLGGSGNVVDQNGVAAARISLNSAANHTSTGSWQKVGLNLAEFDSDGMYNAATNALVIKTPGIYKLDGQVTLNPNASGADRVVSILVNGKGVGESWGVISATSWSRMNVSGGEVALAAGDVVTLYAYQNSGGSLAYLLTDNVTGVGATNLNWLSAVRVGGNKTVTPRARAYRSAALSQTTSGSWQKIALDSLQSGMDNDGMYDVVNGRLVIKTTGAYLLSGQVSWATHAGSFRTIAAISTNNNHVGRSEPAPAMATGADTTQAIDGGIVDLAVGDIIELRGWQNSGGSAAYSTGTVDGYGVTWLSVVKVGPSGGGAGIDPGWAVSGNDLQSTNSGNIKSGGAFIGKALLMRGTLLNFTISTSYQQHVLSLTSGIDTDSWGVASNVVKPTRSGYYRVTAYHELSGGGISSGNDVYIAVYKTGVLDKQHAWVANNAGLVQGEDMTWTLFCNGTTDTISFYSKSGASTCSVGGYFIVEFLGT